MKSLTKKAWVLTGDGINCEAETAEACARAGFQTEILHLSELIRHPRSLADCSLLVIPGGFSFGDELGSGRILSLKLKYQLDWDLAKFARDGGLVLGICNGFQALVALGAFGEGIALAANSDGRFRNEWTDLEANMESSESVFLKGISEIELPIRHGEGRLLYSGSTLPRTARAALKYRKTPNGSMDGIAGLSDATGRILGLMPHPEGFQRASQHPGYFRSVNEPLSKGAGLKLFENAFTAALSKETQ